MIVPSRFKKAPVPHFLILDSLGNEVSATPQTLNETGLRYTPQLVTLMEEVFGLAKPRPYANHMDVMRQLEWVDYEPASDKGHFRYYPKGALIRQLLSSWSERVSAEVFGAHPIKTPFIYRVGNEAVQQHIGPFTNNVYEVDQGQVSERFVLRFNDDLGLYEMMKAARITHNQMPVRVYEQTPSFRYIQEGGVSGINRGRYFSLTDIHSFCRDIEQGLFEYSEIHRLMRSVARKMGLDLTLHFKVTQDFYPSVKQTIVGMMEQGDQVLIELLPGQKQYWAMKHIASTDHPQRLFHVQFDLDSSERFGIQFHDHDGLWKNSVIIHSSFGTAERWMFITLEDALKKDPPVLPLWLAPVQVRVIPVSEEKHLGYCLKVAEELKRNHIRVDVDERNESLNWRIRASGREWIPYVVVCGDKEQAGAPLSVRVRGGDQQQMSVEELVHQIQERTASMPYMSLPELRVSKKPVFRGRD